MTRLAALAITAMVALVACASPGASELVVGSRPDSESVLLAEIYAAALRSVGEPARTRTDPAPLIKLDAGEFSIVPGFTGRLLQRFDPTAAAVTDAYVYRALAAALPEGIAAGDDATGAEDKPAAAVTAATAAEWGGRELTALVRNCSRVVAAAVAGSRPPTVVGACQLFPAHEFPSEAALFDALRAGRVNTAWTSTADPDVPADVVVLDDRHPPLLRAENVVPLYRRNMLSEPQVLAINEVAGELDTAALIDMRRRVAGGADPRQVAEAWVAAHPLGR